MDLFAGEKNSQIENKIFDTVDNNKTDCSQSHDWLILAYIVTKIDWFADANIIIHSDKSKEDGKYNLAQNEEKECDRNKKEINFGGHKELFIGFWGDLRLFLDKSILEFRIELALIASPWYIWWFRRNKIWFLWYFAYSYLLSLMILDLWLLFVVFCHFF